MKDFPRFLSYFSRRPRAFVLGFGTMALSAALFLFFGPWIYALASGNILTADRALLACFLIPIPLNAVWYTSSMVQLAGNRHEGVAKRYILSTLVALTFGIPMTKSLGLPGAALATAASDLLMIPYVLRRSVAITQDDLKGIWGRAFKDISKLPGRYTP